MKTRARVLKRTKVLLVRTTSETCKRQQHTVAMCVHKPWLQKPELLACAELAKCLVLCVSKCRRPLLYNFVFPTKNSIYFRKFNILPKIQYTIDFWVIVDIFLPIGQQTPRQTHEDYGSAEIAGKLHSARVCGGSSWGKMLLRELFNN